MKDRSLVVFTILSQTAVGAYFAFTLIHAWLLSQMDIESADLITYNILLAIILIMGAGLLASFFHLGDPLNSWRAIRNLRSSWLSREILFALLFFVLLCFSTALQWLNVRSPRLQETILSLTLFVGLILIYSMAKVYSLRTIPSWDVSQTFAIFVLSSLLLGGLFFSAAYTLNWANRWFLNQPDALINNAVTAPLYSLGALTIFLIGVEIVRILIYTAQSPLDPGNFHRTDPLPTRLKMLSTALLLISAVVILSLFIFPFNARETLIIFLSAFGLVLVAETANRIVFYQSRRPTM